MAKGKWQPAPPSNKGTERDTVYYFEARGTEFLEFSPNSSVPHPPARTERLLVYATYRRRRRENRSRNECELPWAFPGLQRGLAYNTIVQYMKENLLATYEAADLADAGRLRARNVKMLSEQLSQQEVAPTSVANVPPTQLKDVKIDGPWCWELYDVDVQPPTWRYGRTQDGALPFGLSALDVEVIETLQEAADRNAHDEASDVQLDAGGGDHRICSSWFGPPDDAIVVAFASKNIRPTTAVRLLRLANVKSNAQEEGGMVYEENKRVQVPNHDPVGPPLAPGSHQESPASEA